MAEELVRMCFLHVGLVKEKLFWGNDGEGGETYFHGDEATANFQRKKSCHLLDLLRFFMKLPNSWELGLILKIGVVYHRYCLSPELCLR